MRQGKRDSMTVEIYTQSELYSFDRLDRSFKCRLKGFERGRFAWEMNSSEGDSVSYRNIRRSRRSKRGRHSIGGKRHGMIKAGAAAPRKRL